MQADRKFDLLYDPLYKTSDSREAKILEHKTYADKKQRKLPSYKNMFSALPDRYPSFSLRSQSLEAARPHSGNQRPPSRTSSASPTRSAKSIKLRRTPTSPHKPTSPSLGRIASTQTLKKLLQEKRILKGSEELYPMALDHAKLKAVFEKALPPITDSGSLALRKQLLEAWESAEWESREAQIRALQEAQLKEFEDGIRAQHAQADGTLSERLSARWAAKSGEAAAAVAKAEHQAIKRAQQLIKLRQQDEYKLAGIKSGNMDDIMSAVGHGMMKLIKDTKTQADLHNLPKDAGIDPGTVSPEIPAYRFTSPAASEQLLRPPSRKELAYTGHLDRVHQAILAEKGPRAGAEDTSSKPAKAILERNTQADILVVDASPEPVLAEEPEEAIETAIQLAAIAAEPASQLAVIDATAQPDTQANETAAEPAAVELEVDVADADAQTNDLVIDQASQEAYKFESEAANDMALEHVAQESLAGSLWAVADGVAVMTEQLLDEAIQGGDAMDADTPLSDELALGAALEATIDGQVSTTEGADITADEVNALRSEGDVTSERRASTVQAAIDADRADDSALTDTKEMLASKAITGSLRGAEEGIIGAANALPIEGYGSRAEEQQALADSILSGGDSILNRATALAIAGAESDPALLNQELDSPSPVSGDKLTLDSLISSHYVPRASTEAPYSTSHLIGLAAGLSLTSPYSGDHDADSAQDSPVSNLDSARTEDDSALTQPANDAYPEGSPAPGVPAPLQLQGNLRDAWKEEESPVQAEGPHDDDAWSTSHPEGAPHKEGALEVEAGPTVLSPGSAEHSGAVSAEHNYDLEVSPITPSLAYGAPDAGSTEMPEEIQLASKGAALKMREEQETLPGAPAALEDESFVVEEAESAEAKVSISLQPRQEWVVGAEITLQDSKESPGAQSTGSVEATAAQPKI